MKISLGMQHEAHGDNGFGYDPYFEYENGLTFAEMGSAAKNAISHRARAMELALKLL